MRKVFLLYQNEMGKTVRKVSILVAMILMFVFIGGCAMTFKGIETVSYPFREDYGIIAERYKELSNVDKNELIKKATLWNMYHSDYSGRAAQQFIDDFISKME